MQFKRNIRVNPVFQQFKRNIRVNPVFQQFNPLNPQFMKNWMAVTRACCIFTPDATYKNSRI